MIGRRGLLARLVASIALTGGLALTVSTAGATAASPGGLALVAYLGAQRIPLGTVASYHCHDRDYPVIRCFLTAADRAAEEAASGAGSGSGAVLANPATLMGPYVRWYRDAPLVYGVGQITAGGLPFLCRFTHLRCRRAT